MNAAEEQKDAKETKECGNEPILHPILKAAGVKPGDIVLWTCGITLNGVGCTPMRCTVAGVHYSEWPTNKGTPAVLLRDKCGRGFRAYPGEMTVCENAIALSGSVS